MTSQSELGGYMKNVVITALLVSLAITGYLLWDTQQQLSSTEDDALYCMELANRASTLALTTIRYGLGKVDMDSLVTVANYYDVFADSMNTRWKEKR